MKKVKKETEQATPVSEPEAETVAPPTPEETIAQLQEDIQQWKNKHAMAYADMDNLRKAQEKTFLEALRYRSEGFIDKLIPALDAFHIALKSPVDDPKVKNYLIGFEYIYNQLQQALEAEGVKVIPIQLNDAFDVKTMNALDAEVSDGPVDRVVKILSPGYQLHDRIVKQAMVIVSKKPDAEKDTESPNHEKDGSQAA
jgi:molecular chaperone GrpE